MAAGGVCGSLTNVSGAGWALAHATTRVAITGAIVNLEIRYARVFSVFILSAPFSESLFISLFFVSRFSVSICEQQSAWTLLCIRFGQREVNGSAVIDFTLCPGSAAMTTDDAANVRKSNARSLEFVRPM